MNRDEYYDALAHYGIKGQSWGDRKYQNPDGTLTAAGRARYLGNLKDRGYSSSDSKYVPMIFRKQNTSETESVKNTKISDPVKESTVAKKNSVSSIKTDTSGMVDITTADLGDSGFLQIAKLCIGGLFGDEKRQKEMLGPNYQKIKEKIDLLNQEGYDEMDVKEQMDKATKLMNEKLLNQNNSDDTNNSNKKKKKNTNKKTVNMSHSGMTRDEYYDSLALAHHGIIGMKWGVRRYQNYDGTRIKNGFTKRRKASEMTDDELRKAINRSRLEKRYSDLTKKNSRTGREAFGKALDVADKGIRFSKGNDHWSRKGIELAKDTKKDVEALSRFNKGKSGKDLSDSELLKAVNRLQLENDYNNLNPTFGEKTAQTAKDTLLVIDALIGTAVTVAAIANTPIGKKAISKGRKFVATASAVAFMRMAARRL